MGVAPDSETGAARISAATSGIVGRETELPVAAVVCIGQRRLKAAIVFAHDKGMLAERLRDNRLVCLMSDRDLTRSGVQVDFFGEPTRMPGGPAMLAARTGAALLPVSLWFTPDGGWGDRKSVV